jgi:hypothetical protein
VALLAPVTIIAALVVLALSGGFGGLGALGQLVSGPAVPAGANAPGAPSPFQTATRLPVVPAGPAPVSAAGHGTTRVAAVTPGTTGTGSGGGGSHPGGGRGLGVGSGGGHGVAPPVPAPPAPTPSPPVSTPAPPPPDPIPALVNQVVAVGVSVTSKLPPPLAAIGTGALASLGQTLNTLLAPQPQP